MKRKKSFDWYATKQRFSIRKYHFSVASVLLGVSLATLAGAETASAQVDPAATNAELVTATAETPVAESALVVEEVAPVVVCTAQIAYRVVQTDIEINTSYKVGQVMYASVPTTEVVASTEVSYTIDPSQVRSGYELADGQLATVTKTIVEGQTSTNILAFSIVKKKEELAGSATTAEAAADGTTGFRAMNVPADSTLPGEGGDVPVISHVPAYVPVDPGTNEPLKPVDPEDPSKGFIPPVPSNPGEDTHIPYVPVKDDGQPGEPGTDDKPGGPNGGGNNPGADTPAQPFSAGQLPNTGESSSEAGVLGAAMLVAALGLAGKRRRRED
ncbi:TPA: YSIRK-type signal peptide-containing protein [Streptococcus suis]